MGTHIQSAAVPAGNALVVTRRVMIPVAELRYRFSRGSGPGGQNVNKVASRVELVFDLEGSPSLTDDQKRRIRTALGRRVDTSGRLTLAAGESRSQWENRRIVTQRFLLLLQDALRPKARRIATAPHGGSKEKRLSAKKARSQVKSLRGRVGPE